MHNPEFREDDPDHSGGTSIGSRKETEMKTDHAHRRLTPARFHWAFFLLVVCLSPPLWSGTIDPSFASKLANVNEGEYLHAIVMLSNGVDLETLDKDLIRTRATLKERHETVVRTLQDMSFQTQPDVKRLLERAELRVGVPRFRSFWGTNAIALHSTQETIRESSSRADSVVM